jgi:hypothetical protein
LSHIVSCSSVVNSFSLSSKKTKTQNAAAFVCGENVSKHFIRERSGEKKEYKAKEKLHLGIFLEPVNYGQTNPPFSVGTLFNCKFSYNRGMNLVTKMGTAHHDGKPVLNTHSRRRHAVTIKE